MSAKTNRLQEFAERLGVDTEFRNSFRRDPYGVAEQYGIDRDETDVILNGDSIDAAMLGIDTERGSADKSKSWFPAMLLRLGGTAAAAVIATLGVLGAPAPQASAARRMYISVRRVRARAGVRARARAGVRARWVVSPISARAAWARFSARARPGARSGVRATYYRTGLRAGVRANSGLWGRYASEDDALKSLATVFPDLEEVEFEQKPPVIVID
jgi:hypothetical protein